MFKFDRIERPYLIAEIGINFNGNLQICKKLIDAAYASSWDCVKFQKRTPEICVPKEQADKMRETPWGTMPYIRYKKMLELCKPEYDYLDRYCKEKPIAWSASVWDIPSFEFIVGYDKIPFIKIPSALITNLELVDRVSRSGRPVLLSTGMSTIEEVDTAVNILNENNAEFALLHCNSSYPAKYSELNLLCIKTLRERYGCVVGYSGHEQGTDVISAAVALGARIIEKHITLDCDSWGTDQKNSIEIDNLLNVRRVADRVSSALGDGVKRVYDSEVPHIRRLRRG